jgi:hypothetical protein
MKYTKLAKVDWFDIVTGCGVVSVEGRAYATLYTGQCQMLNGLPNMGDNALVEVYDNGYLRTCTTLLVGRGE